MMISALRVAATTGAAILALLGLAAQAADIRVIGANPMKTAVQELGAQFERDTGHKLVAKFVTSPLVKREIDAGEAFDLAITVTPHIDGLIKEGKIVAGSRADVAYAGVGMGVRVGAPKPDIGSVEAFRQALLNVSSVAHSTEGASGVHFKALLERLGIAEQMKPKLRPMTGDALANAVPRGEAEMIFSAMPDIARDGTVSLGPLPPELQLYVSFAAGVGANAREAEAAMELIRFLTAPTAAPVIRAKGMEPGVPR